MSQMLGQAWHGPKTAVWQMPPPVEGPEDNRAASVAPKARGKLSATLMVMSGLAAGVLLLTVGIYVRSNITRGTEAVAASPATPTAVMVASAPRNPFWLVANRAITDGDVRTSCVGTSSDRVSSSRQCVCIKRSRWGVGKQALPCVQLSQSEPAPGVPKQSRQWGAWLCELQVVHERHNALHFLAAPGEVSAHRLARPLCQRRPW